MSILEQIMQMKSQGINDENIINNLREQGISPAEISNTLNQAQIKSAVQDEENIPQMTAPEQISQEFQGENLNQGQQNFMQQDYYPQENYTNYSSGTDTGLVMEISDQVFSEKIKPLQKVIKELGDFKAINQIKIENLEARLKKIESIIDKLELAILERVGAYAGKLDTIKKGLELIEDNIVKSSKKAESKSGKK